MSRNSPRKTVDDDDDPSRNLMEKILNETLSQSMESEEFTDALGPGNSRKSANTTTTRKKKNDHGGALLLLLFVALIGCQIGVLYWKQNHFRSYQTFTLWGLWLIPFALAVMMGNYRFIFVWTVFSIMAAFVIKKAIQRPLSHETPR